MGDIARRTAGFLRHQRQQFFGFGDRSMVAMSHLRVGPKR